MTRLKTFIASGSLALGDQQSRLDLQAHVHRKLTNRLAEQGYSRDLAHDAVGIWDGPTYIEYVAIHPAHATFA